MARKIIKQPRDFPSVEELLQENTLTEQISSVPRPLAAQLVREVIAQSKKKLKQGSQTISIEKLLSDIRSSIVAAKRDEISRVINATGIVVHTNLGRAPLSEALFEAIKRTVTGYGNIEFDLGGGSRGERGAACERYLTLLAGSESATVVNNCAAALFLILNTLANRKQVLISRGELIQIGGGFRIPDILKKSGATLHEIGATNITTIADYESNVNQKTGLILKVHKSNFVQAGFTEEVPLKQLVGLGATHGLPVVNDLGSGAFVSTRESLGYAEPTVQQSVRDGADLTCFSGDKMLGGVQAGLIVGRAELVKKIKRNPLFRTVRVDKFVFSMLEKLLAIYLNGSHQTEIKLWAILSVPESKLYEKGKALLKELGHPSGLSVEATKAYVGGGALPESNIPSIGIVFSEPFKATTLVLKFRMMTPPIIGRIDNERFILDLKAVADDELALLRDSIKIIIKG
ncbi:MAG: L-seryl-tRNA(Sec) selenium transferase [Candidatus Zixiibacteriota bacterium]|nr:MAG: L-seryl-tRNA(Sec) selenium transferase [candidate division Zixibacteria bacterium]